MRRRRRAAVLPLLLLGLFWGAGVRGARPGQPYLVLAADYGAEEGGAWRRSDAGGADAGQLLVPWPKGARLPPRHVPLRVVAAVNAAETADPQLTQRELSEVVYYSSMDLRKLNNTRSNHKTNHQPESFEENEYYEDDEAVEDDFYVNEPAVTQSPPKATSPKVVETTTTTQPAPTTYPTPPADDGTLWTTSSSATTSIRRHQWTPSQRRGTTDDDWLEAESVAYIVVGTSCGLSVLTLAIVLLVLRMRRSGSSLSAPGTESTSSETSSEGGSSLHLPQRLLNLMNDHSQSASTHKLGSWFTGRPSTALSIHGGAMAFPKVQAPTLSTSFEAENDFGQTMMVGNSIIDVEVNEQMMRPSSSSSSTAGGDAVDSQIEEDSLQQRSRLEALLDELDEAASVSGSTTSRHDTFIYWSSNSDRLV